jgi:hypothetical protein
MPLATNPKALFEIVLESDNELPEGERPVFIYHYLTGLEQIELTDLIATIDKSPSLKNLIETVFKAAETELVSWRNVFDKNGKLVLFSPHRLKEIMGYGEAITLARQLLQGQVLSLDYKKKSDGLSKSNTGKSAKGAKARKNAPTG